MAQNDRGSEAREHKANTTTSWSQDGQERPQARPFIRVGLLLVDSRWLWLVVSTSPRSLPKSVSLGLSVGGRCPRLPDESGSCRWVAKESLSVSVFKRGSRSEDGPNHQDCFISSACTSCEHVSDHVVETLDDHITYMARPRTWSFYSQVRQF